MTVTKITDATGALYTVLKAALTVDVLDGPGLSQAEMPTYVVIGHDDDPDSNEAGTYDQQISSIDMVDRQELGAIFCLIVAQSGSGDMATLRTATRDTANAIDTALRANPTLSGVVGRAWYGLTGATKQEANNDGIFVRLTCTINYEAAV
jgi:hypothetical protein